jgi:ankyrin repeat protein/HEAT repeat protein
MLLCALLVAGCDGLLLSKEQRQVNTAVRQAIAMDPSRINAPYAGGEPPLHVALTYHLPALFDWLLDQGADPNARDNRGTTALHKAVIFVSPDHRALRTLLARGGHVNGKGDDGRTPLHVAALLSGASSVEVLLAAGADPRARDQSGETPLHCAASPQPTASPENVTRTIHLLVAGGADVGAHRGNGDTPLHLAALVGSVLAVRALLNEGAGVDVPGLGGSTGLHVAAKFARPAVAEILLKAGADPNRRDDGGLTPLGSALRYPAMTSHERGAGPVDTRGVVDVLRRFGALDASAPPVVTHRDVSPEAFYRRLDESEQLSRAKTSEVSEAVAFLDEYLRNPERYDPGTGAIERARAALVLFRMQPESEIARSTLAELMDFVRASDDSGPDYLGIARGLEALGSQAEPLYPALFLDALTDYEVANRGIAIDALSKIIPARGNLVASLRRIQVEDWDISALIANIYPADHELRSEVALALRHPYPSIRTRAISVVSVIPSPDTAMLAEVEKLTRDPDARVRKKALEALDTIRDAR